MFSLPQEDTAESAEPGSNYRSLRLSLRFSPVATPALEDSIFDLVARSADTKCSKLRLGDNLYIQPQDPQDVTTLLEKGLAADPLLKDYGVQMEAEERSLAEIVASPPKEQLAKAKAQSGTEAKPTVVVAQVPGARGLMCQICECNPATTKCLDCTKNAHLCNDCYACSHKGGKKRLHLIVPITSPAAAEKPAEKEPSPAAKEETKQAAAETLFPCAAHPKESRRFICRKCDQTVCSICLILGEHRGHEAVGFREVGQHVRETKGRSLTERVKTVDDIRALRNEALEISKRVASSAEDNRSLIETKFAELDELVWAKKRQVLEAFTGTDKANVPLDKINALMAMGETEVGSARALLEESAKGTITPDRYDSLNKAAGVVLAKDDTDLAQQIREVRREVQHAAACMVAPEFDFTGIKAALDSCIAVGLAAAESRRRYVAGVKQWRVMANLSASGQHIGVAYDETTDLYFAAWGYTGGAMKMYNTLEDLMTGKAAHDIAMEFRYDGTYFAATNGSIFYAIEDSGKVARMDEATGRVTSTISLPNAGRHNDPSAYFKCGGCTDIAIMLDPASGTVYAMYQDVIMGECKVTRIVLEGTSGISMGETRVLTGKKKSEFGFAFVHTGQLYLGSDWRVPKVDYAFCLDDGKWEEAPNVTLPGDLGYITHVMAAPGKRLFVSERNRGLFCLRPD